MEYSSNLCRAHGVICWLRGIDVALARSILDAGGVPARVEVQHIAADTTEEISVPCQRLHN